MVSTLKSYKTKSVTTERAVLTVPAATIVTVVGMTVANASGQTTEVSVLLDDTYLVKDAVVMAGSAIVPVGGDQKVVVNASSSIKVVATNAVDVICSVLEQK